MSGPGKTATRPSLFTRSRKRVAEPGPVLPDADPLEARREQALLQSTAAKLVMTQHKIEELRKARVHRARQQAEIGAAVVELLEELTDAAPLAGKAASGALGDILEAIAAELDGIESEALRVTR